MTPLKALKSPPGLKDELTCIELIQRALRGSYVLVITPVEVAAYSLDDWRRLVLREVPVK